MLAKATIQITQELQKTFLIEIKKRFPMPGDEQTKWISTFEDIIDERVMRLRYDMVQTFMDHRDQIGVTNIMKLKQITLIILRFVRATDRTCKHALPGLAAALELLKAKLYDRSYYSFDDGSLEILQESKNRKLSNRELTVISTSMDFIRSGMELRYFAHEVDIRFRFNLRGMYDRAMQITDIDYDLDRRVLSNAAVEKKQNKLAKLLSIVGAKSGKRDSSPAMNTVNDDFDEKWNAFRQEIEQIQSLFNES